jgi:hypothetical protein
MNSLTDALPKIDFSYYRKIVSDPTLVDKLQKEVRIILFSFSIFDKYFIF